MPGVVVAQALAVGGVIGAESVLHAVAGEQLTQMRRWRDEVERLRLAWRLEAVHPDGPTVEPDCRTAAHALRHCGAYLEDGNGPRCLPRASRALLVRWFQAHVGHLARAARVTDRENSSADLCVGVRRQLDRGQVVCLDLEQRHVALA